MCFSECKGLCSSVRLSAAVRLDSNYYETCHRCELGGTSTALVSQLARNIIIIIIIVIIVIITPTIILKMITVWLL